MGDWERKDPDEEFEWKNRRILEIHKLLDRLLDDEAIEHDVFLECVDDVTARICKAMKKGETK